MFKVQFIRLNDLYENKIFSIVLIDDSIYKQLSVNFPAVVLK